ncbi:MAG: sporulation integral membrane protein YtvI [Acutalibacteraceae bacterium]
MDYITETKRKFIIDFVYAAIFIGLYVFLVKYALAYIWPFLVAAALAIFLQKPVKAISKKLRIKAHGVISILFVLLIVCLAFGIIGGAITLLVSELKDFFSYLFAQFSTINEFINTVEELVMSVIVKLPKTLSNSIGGYVSDFFIKLQNGAGQESGSIDLSVLSTPLSGAWSVVKGIPSAFLAILVLIISCVFMTSGYDEIKTFILGFFSEEKGKRIVNSKRTVTRGIGKLVKAYATIMLITFAEMFLGLSFMKLIGVYDGGYTVVIAFVTCVVDIIPVLGTGTIIIPWAVYSLIMGRIGLAISLIVLYAIITVLRQIIEPKLVANQAGLPAIVTIIAMFIGARVFGAIGVILLPLTVIVLKLMYDDGVIGKRAMLSAKKEYEKELEESASDGVTDETAAEVNINCGEENE